MDVGVTPRNEKAKVSNQNIPDDLAFSIMSKLPLKSLKPFGCCCKSWRLLFENPTILYLTIVVLTIIMKHLSSYNTLNHLCRMIHILYRIGFPVKGLRIRSN